MLASGTADFLVLANAGRRSVVEAVGCGGGVNVWVDGAGFVRGWRSRAGWFWTESWSCFGDGCGLNLGRIFRKPQEWRAGEMQEGWKQWLEVELVTI